MGVAPIFFKGKELLVGVLGRAFFDSKDFAFGNIRLAPWGWFIGVGCLGIASRVFIVGVLSGVLEEGLARGWTFQGCILVNDVLVGLLDAGLRTSGVGLPASLGLRGLDRVRRGIEICWVDKVHASGIRRGLVIVVCGV